MIAHEAVGNIAGTAVGDNTTPVEKRNGTAEKYLAIATVRGGEMLVTRVAPELADGYMAFYLARRRRPLRAGTGAARLPLRLHAARRDPRRDAAGDGRDHHRHLAVADESRDLPARMPLDRSALERVLARAAELQAAEGEGDEPGLTDAQLVEIAKEVGLAPANLRQALAEERSRGDAPAARGALDVALRQRAARRRRAPCAARPRRIMAALELSMQQEEGLRVKRRFPDRTLWERAPGIVANLSRAFDVAGRGYHLGAHR